MIKIPSHVVEFSGGNTDLYTAFADYYNHFASNQGSKGLEYDATMKFSEKEALVNEAFKSEVYKRAGMDFSGVPLAHVATNPTVHWASFSILSAMVDTILPQTLIDTIGIYTDVKTGGYGDSFAFDVSPRDLFAVTKFSNGKRYSEVKKQFKGTVTLVPEARAITVGVSLYRVLAGKESLAEFAMKAAKSIESQITIDAYKAFDDAMYSMHTNADTQLYVNGYTQDALVGLCQKVTAYNGGAKAVIVGTQLALSKVLPAGSAYRFMLDSEYVKMGYIQTAFGYDVMALPQVSSIDSPFSLILDDTRLYIISPSSQKLIKLCLEGDTQAYTNQAFDNADLTQKTVMVKRWIAGLITNSVFGMIEIS